MDFEGLDVNVELGEGSPKVKLKGDSWNSKKVRVLRKTFDQAYQRWRKNRIRLARREESEK